MISFLRKIVARRGIVNVADRHGRGSNGGTRRPQRFLSRFDVPFWQQRDHVGRAID